MQNKVVEFPETNGLDEHQKLALALFEIKKNNQDVKEQLILKKAVQAILHYEKLSQDYVELYALFSELQCKSDLEITLIEHKLAGIVELILPADSHPMDIDNFTLVKKVIESVLRKYQDGEQVLNDAIRIIAPYQSNKNTPLSDAIRKLIIDSKAKKFQVDELTREGETGQSDIFRLTSDLMREKVKSKRSLVEKEQLAESVKRAEEDISSEKQRSIRFWQYYKTKKSILLEERSARAGLERALLKEKTLREALDKQLHQSEEHEQSLTTQLKGLEGEFGIRESKLAIKSEYASTLSGEKKKLLSQVEPIKAKLVRRTVMLQSTSVLLVLAISVIGFQNMNELMQLKGLILQFFTK